MITQRVAWRDGHTAKGALKWRWGTVAAVALSKMDDGQLAYEYLIAGGDGSMYLRWDHQLLRPSDGEVDPFREARTMAVGTTRHTGRCECRPLRRHANRRRDHQRDDDKPPTHDSPCPDCNANAVRLKADTTSRTRI